MERQSKHEKKTEISKGYWDYKTRYLKQLRFTLQGSCNYLQGSNRNADIENRRVETVREDEGETNRERSIKTLHFSLPLYNHKGFDLGHT